MTSNSTTFTWNGPVCTACGACYLGSHTCSHADIVRRINELMALLERHPRLWNGLDDPTATCPCRPENGGSGVCGCVLGGPRITCSALKP